MEKNLFKLTDEEILELVKKKLRRDNEVVTECIGEEIKERRRLCEYLKKKLPSYNVNSIYMDNISMIENNKVENNIIKLKDVQLR